MITRELDPREVCPSLLFPEERAFVEQAIEKRCREFAAGRHCARDAIAELGLPPGPILRDDGRAPLWPDNVVGSITHTEGRCAAAVALATDFAAIGIDIEPDEPIEESLWKYVAVDSELAWIEEESRDPGRLVRFIFCAKEAFYKCQYPITKRFLDFHAARLVAFPIHGQFELELLQPVRDYALGARFQGRVNASEGYIRVAMTWAR